MPMQNEAATSVEQRPGKEYPPAGARPALFWAFAYKLSDALFALSDIGVLRTLAAGPQSAGALAAQTSAQTKVLAPLLELLCAAQLAARDGDRYRLHPELVGSLELLELESRVRNWHSSQRTLERVLRGDRGQDPLDAPFSPDLPGCYNAAMASAARPVALHLCRAGRLRECRTLLDLGGADGCIADELAGLTGARVKVVDRAHNQAAFAERSARSPRRELLEFRALDLREPQALRAECRGIDAVILSNLLHLLARAELERLFELLLRALPSQARLVIYDQFLASPPRLDLAQLMVVDWLRCGADFDWSAAALARHLGEMGYLDASPRNAPGLPGAIVVAFAPGGLAA